MKQNLSLHQKMSLGMTQHMQQALKFLQMTNVELTEEIQSQHEDNPFLIVEFPDLARHSACAMEALSNAPAPPPHWREDFLQEVRVHFPSRFDAAMFLLEAIDEQGFLPEIPVHPHYSSEALLAVLDKIKHFGPPGLFSKNRIDFLRTSLMAQGLLTETFEAFLQLMDQGMGLNIKKICTALHVKEAELGKMLSHLKAFPQSPLESTVSSHMEPWPDLLLDYSPQGEWQVSLNLETLPKVSLDKSIFQAVMDLKPGAIEAQFCQIQWGGAKSLCTAIEQRSKTLLIIAHTVLMAQKGFLMEGERALKTLTLKDVSLETGYHESTISRAIAHKTIQTPFGVMALKKFFRQGIAQKETFRNKFTAVDSLKDERVSSSAVQSEIRRLIREESPQHPLSDESLVLLLSRKGWIVARRTVAKYREALHIPSSHQRRQFKGLSLVLS